jgi:hypothetical protein
VERPVAARKRRKSKSRLPLWIVGGAAAAVLAVVALAAFLFSGSGDSQRDDGSSPSRGNPLASSRPVAGLQGTIEFQLGDAPRDEVGIRIDGQAVPVSTTGPIRIDVPAGNRRVVLQRRRFQQVDMQVLVPKGDCVVCTPEWTELWLEGVAASDAHPTAGATGDAVARLGFDDWLQDFEAAKRVAAEQRKNILILFDGSDWCGPSIRMAENVFFQPRFLEGIQMS